MGSSYKRTLTRRQRSQVKFGNIREVLRTHRKNPFDAHLARLCVLYEDLRMEIEGIRARNVPKLDVLDPRRDHLDHPERMGSYRRHYFLRRSIATLREFAECFGELRKCPEFQALLAMPIAVKPSTRQFVFSVRKPSNQSSAEQHWRTYYARSSRVRS